MCPFLDLLLVLDLISSLIDYQSYRLAVPHAVLIPQLTESLTVEVVVAARGYWDCLFLLSYIYRVRKVVD